MFNKNRYFAVCVKKELRARCLSSTLPERDQQLTVDESARDLENPDEIITISTSEEEELGDIR